MDDDGKLTIMLGSHGYYWLKVRPLSPEGEPMTTTTAFPVIRDECMVDDEDATNAI